MEQLREINLEIKDEEPGFQGDIVKLLGRRAKICRGVLRNKGKRY
jgi:hypothetical protein